MKSIIFIFLLCNVTHYMIAQNVGIGTTTPSAKLEIFATPMSRVKIRSNSLIDTTQLILSNRNVSNLGTDFLFTSAREQGLKISTKSDLSINNKDSIFFIKPNGLIGINYTKPTEILEVNGNIALRGLNLFEFGKGVAGKEINAGKIGYNAFGTSALTIVGGGTNITNRKVFFFAEGGVQFNGGAQIDGNLSIGTNYVPSGYKMSVDGKIIAEEMRIQNSTSWPDYVFDNDYKLITISEIEKFITQNKHLPNVPSAEEVSKTGIIIGDMQKILLRKIEELTLYIIDQQKQIDELKIKFNEK